MLNLAVLIENLAKIEKRENGLDIYRTFERLFTHGAYSAGVWGVILIFGNFKGSSITLMIFLFVPTLYLFVLALITCFGIALILKMLSNSQEIRK